MHIRIDLTTEITEITEISRVFSVISVISVVHFSVPMFWGPI